MAAERRHAWIPIFPCSALFPASSALDFLWGQYKYEGLGDSPMCLLSSVLCAMSSFPTLYGTVL